MRRRVQRGFTLVELMVALVAGIVIAMAVVALAKTATNAFHEQVRMATVEANLRMASERLRNDLLRASYMGTGNIKLDPKVALKAGVGPGARYASMQDMQGLRIFHRGSPANTLAPGNQILSTVNGLYPDSVEITGNLATDDSYNMKWLGAGNSSGPRLTQRPNADAAVARLVGGPNWASLPPATINALVQAAFRPTASTFWARVVDPKGCHHYVEVDNAGWDSATSTVFVDVKPALGDNGILESHETGDVACGGNQVSDEFQVSPLTRVRWSIASDLTNVRIGPSTPTELIEYKFNLQREVLDAAGASIRTPEIIAENTVDLKFGVIVDVPVVAGAPPNIVTVDMDPDSANAQGETPAASTTSAGVGQKGAQRVRAVRYRLTVRSATPDQKRWLNILPSPSTPYIVRYCTRNQAPKQTACTEFARARSLVSEVALINQARFNY